MNYKQLLIVIILTSLLHKVSGQEQVPDPLMRESVVFNLDRSIYLPGEKMIFSASVLEADNYQPSALSRIVRVEMINSVGEQVFGEKIEVSESRVSHELPIPDKIATGWYMVRAYTEWMKNFPDIAFSSTTIRIFNQADIDRLPVHNQPDTLNLCLYPEGGSAPTGRKSTFAARVTNQFGQPCSVRGVLMSPRGDTLDSFLSGKAGWATMHFPSPADSHYSFKAIDYPGIKTIVTIRQISEQGPSLSVKKTGDYYEVSLEAAEGSLSGAVRLVVHSQYTLHWFEITEQAGSEMAFRIPAKELPAGICQLTVLNNRDTVIARRLLLNGNPVAEASEVSLDKTLMPCRTGVTGEFSTGSVAGSGSFNLLVRKREPVEQGELYIPGMPGWPCNYEIPLDEEERNGWIIAKGYSEEVTGQFTRVYSNEPFTHFADTSIITSKRETIASHMPETRGLVLSGEITDLASGNPVVNEVLTLTALKDKKFYATSTFETGRFHFSLPGRTGYEDLVLSYVRAPEKSWKLDLYPDFDIRRPVKLPKRVPVTSAEIEYIIDLSIKLQLESVFEEAVEPKEETENVPTQTNGLPFYGVANTIKYIDNYIDLPDIREVLYEVVPYVMARKDGERYIVKISNENFFSPGLFNSLILVDGIPITHFEEFLALPPSRFSRVEVVEDIYVHGSVTFAGIVNFVSKNGDLAGLSLPEESRIISLAMPLKSQPAGKSITAAREINIPGLERVLYCDPFCNETSGTISFNSNDNHGEYIFRLSGFDGIGRYYYASSPFTVTGTGR